MLQNFALLPDVGEHVPAWWLHDPDGRGKERDGQLNYYVLVVEYHKSFTESAVLLTEALRTALASSCPIFRPHLRRWECFRPDKRNYGGREHESHAV